MLPSDPASGLSRRCWLTLGEAVIVIANIDRVTTITIKNIGE
jgi:hypothetical protein